MKIVAKLPDNRWNLGTWFILDDDGNTILPVQPAAAFVCDGKSDNLKAAHEGNPQRDPTKKFGDTPTGEYIGRLGYVPDTPGDRYAYGLPDDSGKIPVIWLTPINGDTDAWSRQESEGLAVNMGLAIHTGPPNGANQLRPTYGCLRTWEKDFSLVIPLIKALGPGATFPVSIQAA